MMIKLQVQIAYYLHTLYCAFCLLLFCLCIYLCPLCILNLLKTKAMIILFTFHSLWKYIIVYLVTNKIILFVEYRNVENSNSYLKKKVEDNHWLSHYLKTKAINVLEYILFELFFIWFFPWEFLTFYVCIPHLSHSIYYNSLY